MFGVNLHSWLTLDAQWKYSASQRERTTALGKAGFVSLAQVSSLIHDSEILWEMVRRSAFSDTWNYKLLL